MKVSESASMELDLPAPIRGLAVGSFGIAFFSFLVWWWIPFGILLATVASGMAFTSIALGVRTKAKGIYFPLGAIAISVTVVHAALLASKLSSIAWLELYL